MIVFVHYSPSFEFTIEWFRESATRVTIFFDGVKFHSCDCYRPQEAMAYARRFIKAWIHAPVLTVYDDESL